MAQFALATFTGGTPGVDINVSYVDETGNTWPTFGAGGFGAWQFGGTAGQIYCPTNCASYANANPANADYYVLGRLVVSATDNSLAGVAGRMNQAGGGYERYEVVSDGSTWTLSYVNSGNSYTTIGTPYSQALSVGTYEVVLEFVGTTINVYIDTVLRITAVDTNISAKGFGGLKGNPLGNSPGAKQITSFEAWDGAFAAFTAITLAGPSSGLVNVASTDFTVSLA